MNLTIATIDKYLTLHDQPKLFAKPNASSLKQIIIQPYKAEAKVKKGILQCKAKNCIKPSQEESCFCNLHQHCSIEQKSVLINDTYIEEKMIAIDQKDLNDMFNSMMESLLNLRAAQ